MPGMKRHLGTGPWPVRKRRDYMEDGRMNVARTFAGYWLSSRVLAGCLLLFCVFFVSAAHCEPAVSRKSVEVYGQKISYLEAGKGPTLVLLHGLGSSAELEWSHVIPELAKTHHVIAPDQLGFGESSKPLIGYGVQTWVDMLSPFLKELHVDHFGLVGASLGGWIAVKYTLEATTEGKMQVPDLLILSDAAGHKMKIPDTNKPFASAPSLRSVRAAMSVLYYDQSIITDEKVMRRFQTKLRTGDGYTIESFWKNNGTSEDFIDGQLGALNLPTLVIWGENDNTIPVAMGRAYAAEIKGAQFVLVPHCGHTPQGERPDVFLKNVTGFLASHPIK